MIKVVIEIEDPDSDAMVRHQLASVQGKIDDGTEDGWAGLETAWKYFQVTRIVGVLFGPGDSELAVPASVVPLEGLSKVTL